MIRNIVFDIGNVLAAFQWKEHYRKFVRSEEEMKRLSDATILNPAWRELDRGVLSHEEVLQLFIRNDPEMEALIRASLGSFQGMLRVYDYSVPWIRALKKAGYGVYFLSNMPWIALQDCPVELTVTKETDGGILSCEDQLIKPDPEIYQLLFDRFGLTPESCVFLDDSEKNVRAAVDAGMHGIVFRDKALAEEELKAMGVSVGE